MATWYQHSAATFDPETGLFSEDMKGLVENFPAMAEGASNAYYIQSAWHPYNGAKVGDGFTGLLYDFDVSGGVASITTPDFVDGYEYRLRLEGLRFINAGIIQIELYRETGAAFTPAGASGADVQFQMWGSIEILRPRVTAPVFLVMSSIGSAQSPINPVAMTGDAFLVSSTKILRARVSNSGLGNTNAGKIFMERRLAYA